jgi:site-specific recombinase XerD
MNHSITPLLKKYFSHYLPVQKGLSVNTVLAYRDAIKLLLRHTADTLKQSVDQLAVEQIKEPVVLDFLASIEKDGCKVCTRNARLAAIRGLFAFIAREEPVLAEQCQLVRSIPLKHTEYRTVEYLEENQMKAVLDAVDINSRTGIRDKALLFLLYNTGARASEVTGMCICDLRFSSTPQVKLHGKGRKDRSIPLWPETVNALKDYIAQLKPSGDGEILFLNANGSPLTRFGLRYITRKYGARAQDKNKKMSKKPVNPHCLRHTTAMHLLHAGNDINMISFWLGHADINTTHIYVEIDMGIKKKMLETIPPPDVKKVRRWKKPSVLKWLESITKQPELCAVNC